MALTVLFRGRAVEEGLTYRFHAAWNSVLQLLGVFFEACGKQAHPVMKKVSWWLLGTGGTWVLGLRTLSQEEHVYTLHHPNVDSAHSSCLVPWLQVTSVGKARVDGNHHPSPVTVVDVDLESCAALALLIFFKCLFVCLSVFGVHW